MIQFINDESLCVVDPFQSGLARGPGKVSQPLNLKSVGAIVSLWLEPGETIRDAAIGFDWDIGYNLLICSNTPRLSVATAHGERFAFAL